MKKNLLAFSFVLLTVLCMVSDVSGIGISPARATFDITEYNPSFNSNIGYTLSRPGTRYSGFSVSNSSGLIGTIIGSSASSGIEYLADGSMIIDWQSSELSSLGSITTTMNFQSPESWEPPVEPGGALITDLVRYSEMIDIDSGIGGIAAVVSQISFWRNYASRVYLQSSAITGLSVNLGLQFEDKSTSWWSRYADRDYYGNPFFSYDIDWDGDGQTDQSGTVTFDEEPVPDSKYPTLFRWTSGIQISTVSLEHVFAEPGDYIATLYITDSIETTSLQIPLTVIPEPATLALFGFGGLFLRKRKS